MSVTIRDRLVDTLREIVGAGVAVIPYADNLDVLERPTILVKQQTIQRLAQAPAARLRIDFVLTFISPASDPAAAETELDQWVPQTLADLEPETWLSWETADKALYSPLNLAYDVTVSALTKPINTEE